jgi:histone H2B
MSTASKAPAKSTEGLNATKKTKDDPPADGVKKRQKVRKETYSSYIFKVSCLTLRCWPMCLIF